MKTKTLLISLLTLCTLFLSSCFKDPCEDVVCENGYCYDGKCDCDWGYTGSRCQTYVGNGGSGGGGGNGGGGTGGGGTGGGSCNYTSYYGPQNCSGSGTAVDANSCCPAGYPFYCSGTGYCYETCSDAAAAGCGNIVYGTGQTGGGGGGGSSCPISGIWVRTSTANNCQGMVVTISGSNGIVTYSPSGCCFSNGQQKWKNINASSCTADDMVLNSFDCEFQRYDEDQIYFNGQNQITVGGITYTRQ